MSMLADGSCLVLMDNGSLRPEASLQLRRVAGRVSELLGTQVHPVSLLHSSKVDPAMLGGEKAQTLVPFMRAQRDLGVHRFTILPQFFGPSSALVDYLPKRVEDLRAEGWAELEVDVLPCLVHEKDPAVAEMMAQLVLDKAAELGWQEGFAVALCDHGTPAKAVNTIRELVADQVGEILGDQVRVLKACSMERREGAEYDFNEPLLENLLGTDGFAGKVMVSMLFAGPGRHAGEGGDVAEICGEAQKKWPSLDAQMSGLLGDAFEPFCELLARRAQGCATQA
ncbi:sirohydrochlorin chelatase [Rubritalea marina]|uniref:sirohydrochlorin chelatase n=1 Tax=Rubritalea marina TaxID=361055 RepID=UPI0003A80A6D|nr:hypothetical protein [Rubritalea marina]